MEKESVNMVVAAILANGMMSANQQSKDPEAYLRAYKGFLRDLAEGDREEAKAKTESYIDAMKNLG